MKPAININQVNREEIEKFAGLVNALTQTFQYSFKDATMPTLYMAAQIWNSRSNFGVNKRVIFNLQNPRSEKEDIIKRFEYVPSIKLRINGEQVANNTLIKEDATNYYEGSLEKLHIYNKTTKSKFIGKVKSQTELVPHGEGFKIENLNTKEQTIYQGQFLDGKKSGYGRQERKYYRYEGQWQDNEKHGIGVEHFLRKKKATQKTEQNSQTEKSQKSKTDDDLQKIEQGSDEEDTKERDDNESQGSSEMKKQSKKHITFSDEELKQQMKNYKVIYNGPFEKGVRSGQDGIQYTKYGVYQGRWEGGLKNGKGIMKYKGGAVYQGDFKNGIIDGEGTYIDEAKNKYQGHFQAGAYNGEGTMTYVNGDVYTGNWIKGKKHGNGTYTYADGDYYDGQWDKDSAHGNGILMTDGLFFQGTFKRGMKDGMGELTDENGDLIKGVWKKNKLQQKISVNGQLCEGVSQ